MASTASKLAFALNPSNPDSVGVFDYEGAYLLTEGTGEGVFLYRADEVAAWLESVEEPGFQNYESFCAQVSPVEDEELALEILDSLNLRICRAGSCSQVISGDYDKCACGKIGLLGTMITGDGECLCEACAAASLEEN